MKKSIAYIVLVLLLQYPLLTGAQPMPVDENKITSRYPFISTVFNRIFNSGGLDSFYHKLYQLKNKQRDQVRIVHIGDSHIQPDFLSSVVRNGFQSFFGNAGRGLVFPYQLAGSNAPADISSSSTIKWEYNRVAHPERGINSGISGFMIKTKQSNAPINFSLRQTFQAGFQDFNRLRFFVDTNSNNAWLLQTPLDTIPFLLKREIADSSAPLYQEVLLDANATSFSLSTLPGDSEQVFYGVSLENSLPGILYHSIGVNGARYDQYNIHSLFWQQLSALQADLFIISLGTNEAQRAAFNQVAFQKELDVFIEQLQKASPGCAILITTAPDSYKGRYSNRVLQQLNKSLTQYCNDKFIALWDLYRIINGFGSAYNWSRRGLMSRDRIHFTADGYRLQGELLLQALAKGYNNYSDLIKGLTAP